MLPSCYFAFTISSCGGEVETSDVERITHGRTLGKLHVHLPDEFRALCLGFDGRCCALRLDSERNEPVSPSRTVLPFSKASITSYCKASNTAFTSALDTVERFSIRFTICANVTGVVGAACG